MRRAVLVLLTLAACGDASVLDGDDAGNPSPDAGMAADGAQPGRDAAVPPPSYAPSPANKGWIGGACDQVADCGDVDEGFCLTEGFPNGMCSRECTSLCPDRTQPGDTATFCTDGRPWGFDEGLCVSRCNKTIFPTTGCAEGYECARRGRYAETQTVVEVCVPLAPRPCAGEEDELIDLDYPDDGKLWIPREARCLVDVPLVVMLHGINPSNNPTPSLGGGRRLELVVRALIDTGMMKPVILAEPVHFEPGSSTLYGAEFDPAAHLALVEAQLQARGLRAASLSYTGHSGAGCDEDNGLYKVLAHLGELVPRFAPTFRLWGLEDVCYGTGYHVDAPKAALGGKGVVLYNMFTEQGDPTSFENGVFPAADRATLDCAAGLYSSCMRHKTEPWCSVRTRATAGIHHNNNPFFFAREVFPQVFPMDPSIQACR